MNRDVDRFVQDPRLLIALRRDVIDRMGCVPDHADADENGAQLRKIAKAVEKPEKTGRPAPERTGSTETPPPTGGLLADSHGT